MVGVSGEEVLERLPRVLRRAAVVGPLAHDRQVREADLVEGIGRDGVGRVLVHALLVGRDGRLVVAGEGEGLPDAELRDRRVFAVGGVARDDREHGHRPLARGHQRHAEQLGADAVEVERADVVFGLERGVEVGAVRIIEDQPLVGVGGGGEVLLLFEQVADLVRRGGGHGGLREPAHGLFVTGERGADLAVFLGLQGGIEL